MVDVMGSDHGFGAQTGESESTQRVRIDPRYHDGVLFDLDGVVTDTAAIHQAAWADLFDTYLAGRAGSPTENHDPFTAQDYRHFIDGKPRYDGVRDFLASRGVALGWGSISDAATTDTVCGLGNRKQQLFAARIASGVPVFESTVALVRRLRDAGVRVGIFSASRNCASVLESAGLTDLFEVRMDGVIAEEMGLAGKPDPAMLVEAARRLGVRPGRTAVIEDSEAGVRAARAGGFGLVIGVDRTGETADGLREFGADAVVGDLAEVRVRAIGRRMSTLPDALASFGQLAGVVGARRPAIFFDFDGTLSEIVDQPGAAALVSARTRHCSRLQRCIRWRCCPAAAWRTSVKGSASPGCGTPAATGSKSSARTVHTTAMMLPPKLFRCWNRQPPNSSSNWPRYPALRWNTSATPSRCTTAMRPRKPPLR
jgi:HAD superfamily hydrolase (TIGR01509 family)